MGESRFLLPVSVGLVFLTGMYSTAMIEFKWPQRRFVTVFSLGLSVTPSTFISVDIGWGFISFLSGRRRKTKENLGGQL